MEKIINKYEHVFTRLNLRCHHQDVGIIKGVRKCVDKVVAAHSLLMIVT